MGYEKRFDNRKFDEFRPLSIKAGVIPNADGSALVQVGNTVAYAAVYGPRDLHPKFMQDPQKGTLRVTYNMMPFSGHGDRVRPGPSRRSKEINLVIENALLPVLDLNRYPNAVVDVFIELPQTDAGTRCAAITAASVALADAGIRMKDMVAAVSVGKVDDKLVVDLTYNEEAYPEGDVADIPVAFIPSTGELSLLQMDGKITPDELERVLEMGRVACVKIAEAQRSALLEKYEDASLKAVDIALENGREAAARSGEDEVPPVDDASRGDSVGDDNE
ncbi:exosome complex exonuclease Rrp41 [Candidatus Woesearchaeota archaeon]|nr:MAG: exosome complex exonuclease Rrp41 [Candidatus Woesearchaeota archaeon]